MDPPETLLPSIGTRRRREKITQDDRVAAREVGEPIRTGELRVSDLLGRLRTSYT